MTAIQSRDLVRPLIASKDIHMKRLDFVRTLMAAGVILAAAMGWAQQAMLTADTPDQQRGHDYRLWHEHHTEHQFDKLSLAPV
jgi:hypothetical protein